MLSAYSLAKVTLHLTIVVLIMIMIIFYICVRFFTAGADTAQRARDVLLGEMRKQTQNDGAAASTSATASTEEEEEEVSADSACKCIFVHL